MIPIWTTELRRFRAYKCCERSFETGD